MTSKKAQPCTVTAAALGCKDGCPWPYALDTFDDDLVVGFQARLDGSIGVNLRAKLHAPTTALPSSTANT
jgi:hypothetical protein